MIEAAATIFLIIGQNVKGQWNGRESGPDVTWLDFYLWGHLKALVYAEKSQSAVGLQKRIIDACNIICGTIRRVIADRVHRLYLCANYDGAHTEHIVCMKGVFIIFASGSRLMGHHVVLLAIMILAKSKETY